MFPPDIVYLLSAIDKQVMSAGCIPVIIARDYVKPFPEEVDWPSFSFTFSPEEVPYMLRTLRSTPPEELIEMQVTRWEIAKPHFGVVSLVCPCRSVVLLCLPSGACR